MFRNRLLALLLLALVITSPSKGFAAPEEVAALISDTSNPYWKAFEEGLRDAASELKVEVSIYTLQSATNAEEQLNKCEAALLKSPRIILFAAVNGMSLASCLGKAHKRGIILIDVDGNVDAALAQKMGVRVAFSVASNNYELGVKAAQYLESQSGEVLVIEGLSGSQPSELRVRGFKENLKGSLKVIGSQPGDWDRMKAADITARMLLRNPKLAHIFAANDTMALGAVEALRANGNTNITVIGIDGSTDAVRSIRDGRLSASVAQLPYLMAQEALNKGHQYLLDGKELSFHQYVPILTLNKEILSQGTEPLLKFLR